MISTYEFLATWLRARFGDTERGASLVEYALLVALIAVICIVCHLILSTYSKGMVETVELNALRLENLLARRAAGEAEVDPRA